MEVAKFPKKSGGVGKFIYPVRIIGYFLATGSIYFFQQQKFGSLPIETVVFLILINLYPHVAYWVYRYNHYNRYYEFANLIADMFWIGFISGFLHFSPIYAFPFVLANSASMLASNGFGLVWKGLLAYILAVGLYILGFGFEFDTSLIAKPAFFSTLYLSIAVYYIGYLSFTKGTVIRKNKKKIEEQNKELQQQHDELTVLNQEIRQQNEEILVQRDNIEHQNILLKAQKDALEDANHSIKESIVYAQRIQQAVLPSNEQMSAFFPRHFVLYRPKHIVSGDFYWIKKTTYHQECLWLAVADCTGHGVPGAFMSLIGQLLLQQIILEFPTMKLSDILTELNARIVAQLRQSETHNKDGMHLGLIKIECDTRTLYYAGSKHSLVWIDKECVLQIIKADTPAIGGETSRRSLVFNEHSLPLASINTFYMFSDGYQDQFGGEDNKKIGSKRFQQIIEHLQKYSIQEQGIYLNSQLQNWMQEGNEKQIDDILVVGVQP